MGGLGVSANSSKCSGSEGSASSSMKKGVSSSKSDSSKVQEMQPLLPP